MVRAEQSGRSEGRAETDCGARVKNEKRVKLKKEKPAQAGAMFWSANF